MKHIFSRTAQKLANLLSYFFNALERIKSSLVARHLGFLKLSSIPFLIDLLLKLWMIQGDDSKIGEDLEMIEEEETLEDQNIGEDPKRERVLKLLKALN